MNGYYIELLSNGEVNFKKWGRMQDNVTEWMKVCGGHFTFTKCANLDPSIYMLSGDNCFNGLKEVNIVATVCYGIGINTFSVAGNCVLVKHEYNRRNRQEIEVPFTYEEVLDIVPLLHRARVLANVATDDGEF